VLTWHPYLISEIGGARDKENIKKKDLTLPCGERNIWLRIRKYKES
jgi:hypothetical protein